MKLASLTFVLGVALALCPAVAAVQTGAQSVQYKSPAGIEYRSLPDTEAVTKAQELQQKRQSIPIDWWLRRSTARPDSQTQASKRRRNPRHFKISNY